MPSTYEELKLLEAAIAEKSAFIDRLKAEMHKAVVGQEDMIDGLLLCLLCKGHALLEGVPGLAKTLCVQTLSKVVDAGFKRIQFTPDLLPADVIGTLVYEPHSGTFKVKQGPIFTNIVLADEINRAPAKVQSALLESMQERQVTLGDETRRLPEPFFVLATQNPIEQEGTYPLPEAQTDRFLLKIVVGYPSREEEKAIMRAQTSQKAPDVEKVVSLSEILEAQKVVKEVYIDEKLEEYILDLVMATRAPEKFGIKSLEGMIEYGASPRATIALTMAAKARAFLRHQGWVRPDDIKAVAAPALRHRIILTYEAEAEETTTDDVVKTLLDNVQVP